MKTIVVAGANGFLGNRLVAEALKKGYKVIGLARDSHKGSARERVIAELPESLSPEEIERFQPKLLVHNYDIAEADLGLSAEVRAEIKKTAEAVFNCIGDTNFFPKNIEELFSTNIDGPKNMITALCEKGSIFNHMSTAYVSGDRSGVILEEELDEDQAFKNHYEKSKFLGEIKVKELCAEKGVRLNIVRPSIVIRRHSVHGKIPNLNHFYSFVGLIDILRQDAQQDAYMSQKDVIIADVRFMGSKSSTLNFVDLDYVVKAMLVISEYTKNNCATYHLTNPKPMTNQQFLDTIMELYKITGFQIIEKPEEFTKPNFRERLVKRGLANYIEYFYVDPRFDDRNARKALAGTGISCPEFDKEYIAQATGHFA